MWIPTETAFVNPGNLAPAPANCSTEHEECGEERYFTDEAVLGKWVANDEKTVKWIFNQLMPFLFCCSIPNCFLLLGGILTVLCIVGLSLVSECPNTLEDTASASAITPATELPSLGMKEVLSSRLFYKIWFGFFAISVTQVGGHHY